MKTTILNLALGLLLTLSTAIPNATAQTVLAAAQTTHPPASKPPVKTVCTEVIDGDTIKVTTGETVRLVGVDTPETRHPNKPVERFGKEASQFTKQTVQGKPVTLHFGQNTKDKYGRTLAYVQLADGSVLNELLIGHGYGHAYTQFPFEFMDRYRMLERYAREHKRGLWAEAPGTVVAAPAALYEGGIAFEGTLVVSAVTGFLRLVDTEGFENLSVRLDVFQKQLKYGLPSKRAIYLYELGFADRVVAQEIAAALPGRKTEKSSLVKLLRAEQEMVLSILEKYPAYFQLVYSQITGVA